MLSLNDAESADATKMISSGCQQTAPMKCNSRLIVLEMKKRRRRREFSCSMLNITIPNSKYQSIIPLLFMTLILISICDITLQKQQPIEEPTSLTSRINQQQISNKNNNNNPHHHQQQQQQNVKLEEEANTINSANRRPSSTSMSSGSDFMEPAQVFSQTFAQSHRRLLEANWALERRLDRLEFEFRKAIHLWQASQQQAHSSDQNFQSPAQDPASSQNKHHSAKLANNADVSSQSQLDSKWATLSARLELVEKFISSSVSKLYETEKRVKQLELCECRQSCRWLAAANSNTTQADTFTVSLKPDGQSWRHECDLCTCQRGQVKCRHLSCPDEPKCERPIYEAGKCCPVCKKDCVFKRQRVAHNSKLIVSGTRDTCKECKCQDGRFTCQRVQINRRRLLESSSSALANEIGRLQRSLTKQAVQGEREKQQQAASNFIDANLADDLADYQDNSDPDETMDLDGSDNVDYDNLEHERRRFRRSSGLITGAICPPADCTESDQMSLANDCCIYCRNQTDFCELAKQQNMCQPQYANCISLFTANSLLFGDNNSISGLPAPHLSSLIECRCKSGFKGDGQFCRDIDECSNSSLNLCDLKSSECLNTLGSYTCPCRAGFKRVGVAGANGQQFACVDIDECADPALNKCHVGGARCINLRGSYKCKCRDGYLGDGHTCHKWISSSVAEAAASYLYRHGASNANSTLRKPTQTAESILNDINFDQMLASNTDQEDDHQNQTNNTQADQDPELTNHVKSATKALADSAWEPLKFESSSFYQQDENPPTISINQVTSLQENDASDTTTTSIAPQGASKSEPESFNTRTMFFQPPPWVWMGTTTTSSTTPEPAEYTRSNTISSTNELDVTSQTEAKSRLAGASDSDGSSMIQTSKSSLANQIDFLTNNNNPNQDNVNPNASRSVSSINSNTNESVSIQQHHHQSSSLVENQPNELVTKPKGTSTEDQPNLQQSPNTIAANNQNQAQPYKKGTIVASATSSPTKGFLTSRIMIPPHASPTASSSLSRKNNDHHRPDQKLSNSGISSQQQSASSAGSAWASSIFKSDLNQSFQTLVIVSSILLANLFISANNFINFSRMLE